MEQIEKISIRTLSNTSGFKTQSSNGRNYIIVPAVPVREQVMNTYYVPAKELEFADMWNGTPITIRHPQRNNGSANVPEPDVAVIGRFFNAVWDPEENRLTGEYWIDVDEAMKYVEGQYIINAVKNGTVLETSTGYWADNEFTAGEFNGRKYETIHHNLKPDHIAILVDEIGACSVADGCGVNRNSLVHQLYQNECLYSQGGMGSGDYGHLGRPGQVGGSQPKHVRKETKREKKVLSSPVNAYYVTSGTNKSKYKNGWSGKASLVSKARAQELFETMNRGGFDPVIFEIKLKKGQPYNSIGSNTITVPSVPGSQVKEIDPETLKERKQQTFRQNMDVEGKCGCDKFGFEVDLNSDSLTETIEKIRKGFYDSFMRREMLEEFYIRDVFDGYVIAESAEDMYKVNFTASNDGGITFDTRDKWVKVGLEYIEESVEEEVESTVENSHVEDHVEANVTGKLPSAGVKIYERVYADMLKKYKGDKAKASKLAWGAVKRAGWVQDDKGNWKKKGGMKGNNLSVGSIRPVVTNSKKEKTMKYTLNQILELIKGKGVDVTVNSDEEELDMELELAEGEDEEEDTTQNTSAAPIFNADEVAGIRKLLAVDWSKVTGVLEKLPTVLEMAKNAETEKQTRKAELVGLILNSSGNFLTQEELEAMSLPVLTKMNARMNVSYAGASGGMVFENVSDDEILGIPSVTLDKEN